MASGQAEAGRQVSTGWSAAVSVGDSPQVKDLLGCQGDGQPEGRFHASAALYIRRSSGGVQGLTHSCIPEPMPVHVRCLPVGCREELRAGCSAFMPPKQLPLHCVTSQLGHLKSCSLTTADTPQQQPQGISSGLCLPHLRRPC